MSNATAIHLSLQWSRPCYVLPASHLSTTPELFALKTAPIRKLLATVVLVHLLRPFTQRHRQNILRRWWLFSGRSSKCSSRRARRVKRLDQACFDAYTFKKGKNYWSETSRTRFSLWRMSEWFPSSKTHGICHPNLAKWWSFEKTRFTPGTYRRSAGGFALKVVGILNETTTLLWTETRGCNFCIYRQICIVLTGGTDEDTCWGQLAIVWSWVEAMSVLVWTGAWESSLQRKPVPGSNINVDVEDVASQKSSKEMFCFRPELSMGEGTNAMFKGLLRRRPIVPFGNLSPCVSKTFPFLLVWVQSFIVIDVHVHIVRESSGIKDYFLKMIRTRCVQVIVICFILSGHPKGYPEEC